jgi:hypothetical protein
MNSRNHEVVKGAFGYEGREKEGAITESEYESLVDRDPETRSPKICRAKQSSENLMESKRFSCSCWFMSVVSFLKV